MLGIYIENSSGEPLTVFDYAVNSVYSQYYMSVCHVCAMLLLLDTARDGQSVIALKWTPCIAC